MDLYEKQKEFQKSFFKKDLTRTIKNKVISKIFKDFSLKIINYKREHLKEIVAKIIESKEKEILNILNVDLKNIEDRLANPFSNMLIDYYEYGFYDKNVFFNQIKESAKKLEKVDDKLIESSFNYFKSVFEEIFIKFKIKNFYKEKQQLTSFFLTPLKSEYVVEVILFSILKLNDNFDKNNYDNCWVEKSEEIFLNVFYKLKDKLKIEIDEDEIDNEIRQEIGGTLIALCMEIGILKESDKIKEKNITCLELNDEFIKKAKKFLDNFSTKVFYKPMIVEPEDWKGIKGGGFLHFEGMEKEYDLYLIKAKTPKKRLRIKNMQIPQIILDGVNYLQKVPFKINKDMLSFIKSLEITKFILENDYKKVNEKVLYYSIFDDFLEELKEINTLIEAENYFYNKDIEYFKEKLNSKRLENKDRALKKLLKIAKDVLEKRDNKEFLKRFKIEKEIIKYGVSMKHIINIADEFKDFEKIYFVYQLDFRGRVYPVQTLLHPQGSDLVKSLLLFSEKREIKNDFWLKVHGANLFGKDKETYENRVKWFDENEEEILKVAKEESDLWIEADEMFEFLAFCKEYAKYKETKKTSLIVSVDGSNNGLQHISTLFRDKNAARRVNVLPTQKVEDVYVDVLEEFKRLIKEDIKNFKESSYKVETISNEKFYFTENVIKEEIFHKNILDTIKSIIEKSDIEDVKYIKEKILLALDKKTNKKFVEDIINEAIKESEGDIEIFEGEIKKLFKKAQKKLILEGDYYKLNKIEKDYNFSNHLKEMLEENRFDRSFIKKPVMIDSYGAGTSGKADKIKESLEEFLFWDEKLINKLSFYLAKKVEEAIDNVLRSSSLYENYMKSIVSDILKVENVKYVEWKTPLGFLVSQVEFKTKSKNESFKIEINDKKSDYKKVNYVVETDNIDKNEHKKGIAPNFVHSLDATHLFMIIDELKKRGITHLRPIHDSFGVYADDVDVLEEVIKDTFIKLYSNSILTDFVNFVKSHYENIELKKFEKYISKIKKEVDEIKGYDVIMDSDFNLEEIRNSKYMFS